MNATSAGVRLLGLIQIKNLETCVRNKLGPQVHQIARIDRSRERYHFCKSSIDNYQLLAIWSVFFAGKRDSHARVALYRNSQTGPVCPHG